MILIPYSRKAKYYHKRRRHPSLFIKSTMRTVPISHANPRIKYPKGTKAIRGRLKSTQEWATQSILIPKSKKH